MTSAGRPNPTMRPTRLTTLVLVVMLAALVAWRLTDLYYGSIPALTWFPSVTVLVLAVAELVLARNTSARILRKPGTTPVEPLLVARFVALAKASGLLGALYAGLHLGCGVWVFQQRELLAQARHDVPPAALGVVAGAVLVMAALLLEHACRVPKPPEDKTGAVQSSPGEGHTREGDDQRGNDR